MFFKHEDGKIINLAEGVEIRVVGSGGSLMLTEVTFRKNAAAATHSHPHEQISYIIKGSLEFTVADETKVVNAGDCVYIPGNAKHGALALEDSMLVDVFTPQRDDFKK